MSGPPPAGPLLSLTDLRVSFNTEDGVVQAVDGISLELAPGKTLGIVGESGSGKSVTGLSILGLHDRRRTKITGSIRFAGKELVGLDERALNTIRGAQIAMVFQDALTALSPFWTVGNQIAEGYRRHTGAGKAQARKRAIDLLGRVGIPQPDRRVDGYPHEFSGGMRQRAMIAMALACDPKVLIADEPTTALDVTVQAQILDLLADLQSEFGTAIIMVTHDLGVISQVADDVLVMYAGRVVESGRVDDVLSRPAHPYTWGLLSSVPRLGAAGAELVAIRGTPPSLIGLPAGCAFRPRCDYVAQVLDGACATRMPELVPAMSTASRCHLDEVRRRRILVEDLQPRWRGGAA
ncbi:MAG TPA: ABC transporter ATP-binding protein [Sporichthyaceae bacterium]|nr:ABC transporter ATP-binding protein [Sporichthyaceae bacterium]